MNVKKAHRKCMVRGCKETKEVFALSITREMGNSVMMCRKCLEDGLSAVQALTGGSKTQSTPGIPDLHSMKKNEMDAFAALHGIEIKGVMKNEERANKILEALASKGIQN